MTKKVNPKKIDENHSFNVNVACVVGERKAIILKEIYGWCLHNYHNQKNMYGGMPWTYNSAKAYEEKFPYWKARSISRWLFELESDGWIYSTMKFNKFNIDKTKWYTINFAKYDAAVTTDDYPISQNDQWIAQIDQWLSQNGESWLAKMTDEIGQNDQPIPSSTISIPPKTSNNARAKKSTKNKSEKPEPVSDQKNASPQVPARPPHESEVDESFLTEPIPDLGQKHWTEVATMMAAYFKNENGFGPMEWKMMCDSAGGSVEPIVITTLWAGKAQPCELLNWKKHTGSLTNWIKNNLKSDRQQEAKIKSMNKGNTNERLKIGSFGNQPQREIIVSKVPV